MHTMLYVDDEPAARQALVRAFRHKPFEITAVSSGEAALSASWGKRFDVAVLDVAMPRMNGLELLKSLRQVDPDLPIIMLTGLSDDAVICQAVELGCDAFLEKPLEPDVLESQIDAVLLTRQESGRATSGKGRQ